jgi:hypothetical protein
MVTLHIHDVVKGFSTESWVPALTINLHANRPSMLQSKNYVFCLWLISQLVACSFSVMKDPGSNLVQTFVCFVLNWEVLMVDWLTLIVD